MSPFRNRDVFVRRGLISVLPDEVEEVDCPVCLEPYHRDDVPVRLPCGHVAGRCCVLRWTHQSTQCPLCRADLFFLVMPKLRSNFRGIAYGDNAQPQRPRIWVPSPGSDSSATDMLAGNEHLVERLGQIRGPPHEAIVRREMNGLDEHAQNPFTDPRSLSEWASPAAASRSSNTRATSQLMMEYTRQADQNTQLLSVEQELAEELVRLHLQDQDLAEHHSRWMLEANELQRTLRYGPPASGEQSGLGDYGEPETIDGDYVMVDAENEEEAWAYAEPEQSSTICTVM